MDRSRIPAAPTVPTNAPTPEQFDLGLPLPQRLDSAEAIQPFEEEECDQQAADAAWLEHTLFGTESK
jgi:hypothetical protein